MIRRTRLLLAAALVVAVTAAVLALLPQRETLHLFPSDKAEHMLAFFTLTTLMRLGLWRRAWPPLFAAVTGFGALIELVQAIPAFGRDASLADLVADMIAAAIALVATWPVVAWRRRRA